MRRLRRRKLWALILAALWPLPAPAQTSETVRVLAGSYVSIARGVPWSGTGANGVNNNWLVQLPKPEGFLCVAVKNNNPTSSHTFSFSAFGSSDPNQQSFISSPSSLWSTLTVNGTFTSVSASSVQAASVPIAGLAIVDLQFSSGTSATGTPDTADIFASQTTSAGCSAISAGASPTTGQPIQGPVTSQNAPTLPNPIVLGAPVLGSLTTAYTFTSPAGRQGAIGIGFLPVKYSDVSDAIGSGTTTKTLFGSESGTFQACEFWLDASNTAGSTPTLNVYVQVSGDAGTTWNDRVSFVQSTTGSTSQEVMLNAFPSAGTGPAATKDGTLTAGSAVNGLLAGNVRAKYVVGGTASPTYTVSLYGTCQ